MYEEPPPKRKRWAALAPRRAPARGGRHRRLVRLHADPGPARRLEARGGAERGRTPRAQRQGQDRGGRAGARSSARGERRRRQGHRHRPAPRRGNAHPEGRPVTIIVSTGVPKATVPDVVGMDYADAVDALTASEPRGDARERSSRRSPKARSSLRTRRPGEVVAEGTMVVSASLQGHADRSGARRPRSDGGERRVRAPGGRLRGRRSSGAVRQHARRLRVGAEPRPGHRGDQGLHRRDHGLRRARRRRRSRTSSASSGRPHRSTSRMPASR